MPQKVMSSATGRALVFRRPLRGKTGCLKCRQRRKKCDEQWPTCGDCKRLRYACIYTKPGRNSNKKFQPRLREEENIRNTILEAYHTYRHEMVILPGVEAMIKQWIEDAGDDDSKSHKEGYSSVSDTGSSSADNNDDGSVSPLPRPYLSSDDFFLYIDNSGIGESPNADKSDGRIFETTIPIWRKISSGFRAIDAAETELDQHIAISIVLHGLKETYRQCHLSDLWKTFLEVYEPLGLEQQPLIERLALLNLSWRFARIEASQKFKSGLYGDFLPRHFDIRALNRYLPNPRAPMINIFPWPGVREHMALRPLRYRKDIFIKNLLSEFRFVFPSIRDAYYINPDTGLYAYSTKYLETRDNLSAWTVTSTFFELFPELEDDITVFNIGPNPLEPTTTEYNASMASEFDADATWQRYETLQMLSDQQRGTCIGWDINLQSEFDFSEFLVDY